MLCLFFLVSSEEQETKDDHGRQKVDLEVVRDGYTEAGMAVMNHCIKPLFMIGAQYGPLGSCVGIVVAVIVSVFLCCPGSSYSSKKHSFNPSPNNFTV